MNKSVNLGGKQARKSKSEPDTERFRLRRFVDELAAEGEVEVVENDIELGEIAAYLDGNRNVVLFKNAGGKGVELVGNVMASRRRIAKALGTDERNLVHTITERLKSPIPPVEVPSHAAPVQEVVLTGKDADFTKLPIHLQHAADGGPYLSATMDFAVDPETGWTNVGVRRHMIRGRQESGVDVVAPSDLRALYLRHVAEGKKLPVSFVIGCTTCDFIGSTSRRPPIDELALLGAIREAPVPVVRCKTNDVMVPADAEYVIEGYFDERGHVEGEGPYGEFLGYYGPMKMNPVFHLTAVTHRRDALFQTVTQAGAKLAQTDVAPLCCVRTEAAIWEALEIAIREPVAVYCTPSSGGYFNVRISMRKRHPGEVRNAIAAALGSSADVKNVFIVDDDIDVFSDEQIDWAISTRFQPDTDLVVLKDIRSYPLDPSLYGRQTGSKAGFDLTIAKSDDNLNYVVALPPRFAKGRKRASVRSVLKSGPLTFGEIMDAAGSMDGRDIVLELDKLRQAGELARVGDGRYALAAGKRNRSAAAPAKSKARAKAKAKTGSRAKAGA